MSKEKKKPLPPAARWSGAAALAALPLGWLFGMILGQGQDAAGAGMALGIGLFFGALAAALLGLVHWFCRKKRSFAFFRRHRRGLLIATGVALVAYAAWYVQPAFEDQRYSLEVRNWSSNDLSNVEVRFSNQTIAIGLVPAGEDIRLRDLSKKPSGVVQVSWIDSTGEAWNVTDSKRIRAPRRFDRGTAFVHIYSSYTLSVGFRAALVK